MERNLVFPLFRVRDRLIVAVSEPANLYLVDELRVVTRLEIEIVAASSKDVRRMITTLPQTPERISRALQ